MHDRLNASQAFLLSYLVGSLLTHKQAVHQSTAKQHQFRPRMHAAAGPSDPAVELAGLQSALSSSLGRIQS